jgi:histidine triad (HIT) family protein
MLTPTQTENLKKQLFKQIEKSFPDDRKEFAKNQIEAMNSEQLEGFLRQNKLIKTHEQAKECVFCSILSGNISSHKIGENPKAIAVLEINPVSKGHSIVIPKEHMQSSEKLLQSVFALAKNVAKRMKTKLKTKNVTITSSNLFGHEIINVIPVYQDQEVSERKPATQEELSELQKILLLPKKAQKRVRKVKQVKSKEKIRLPKRIP